MLSDGTEDYDRGEKLESYQQMPSLKECLFVSHRSQQIEVVRRVAGGWVRELNTAGQRVALTSVPCTLDVDAIYARVPEITT